MNNYFMRVIFALCLLLIAICLLTGFMIVYTGFTDNLHKSDVAIVLGSKVNANATPSSRLTARLDKSIELYKEGYFNTIIVSGGIDKGVDEAMVMKKYLMAHNIPAAAIITDNRGIDTAATARNSLLIMQQRGFKSALIISQYFHIMRSRFALRQCGISPIYNAHANYFSLRDLYSIPREIVAYYDYLLFRRCIN